MIDDVTIFNLTKNVYVEKLLQKNGLLKSLKDSMILIPIYCTISLAVVRNIMNL